MDSTFENRQAAEEPQFFTKSDERFLAAVTDPEKRQQSILKWSWRRKRWAQALLIMFIVTIAADCVDSWICDCASSPFQSLRRVCGPVPFYCTPLAPAKILLYFLFVWSGFMLAVSDVYVKLLKLCRATALNKVNSDSH